MRKTVVYGLGKYYSDNKEKIFSEYDVVALMDGRESLRGEVIEGLKVIIPSDLELIEYDEILITPNEKNANSMTATLAAMDVPLYRVKHLLFSMEYLRGYDRVLTEKYINKNRIAEKGYVTDILGVKHSVADLPHLQHLEGQVLDTMVCHDDLEIVGLLLAVESRCNDQFVMFEFGAGWAPWLSAAAFAANMSMREDEASLQLYLNCVEAEANKIPLIKRHLLKNALLSSNHSTQIDAELHGNSGNVHVRIINGAIRIEPGIVEFPMVEVSDFGASLTSRIVDDEGNSRIILRSYTPSELFEDYDIIDFVHVDVQGCENELFSDSKSLDAFKKVRYLVIGTHSREIEMVLLRNLHNARFTLIREQPCELQLSVAAKFDVLPDKLTDMTIVDGVQVWRNMRFNR